ncbi:hypothetical protein Hamer_G028281, partial [Homarus americanus]
RKTMPKIKFSAGVFVHVNEKGRMDEQGIKLWIDHIWCRRPGGFRKQRSLLCGISNSMDGMEDDMLWEDEDETEAEATSSDLEFDPYDEAAINVSQDVLEELMMSDVDDVDFEGF